MTNEELKRIEELERQVKELMQYIKAKKNQQVSFPLDNPSTLTIAKSLQNSGYIIT